MGISVAIVSGKGGSGKTVIAAEVAGLMSRQGLSVILMDADTGTGGLSYYLGLKYVRNIVEGFSTYVLASLGEGVVSENGRNLKALTQLVQDTNGPETSFRFLAIGDHRRLSREFGGQGEFAQKLESLLRNAVKNLAKSSDFLVVDCRGGIDSDSLAVCGAVDGIIMVVEADPTSFQASQHLVDVLADNDLSHKLHGFIINKAIEDPAAVARTAGRALRTQYLGAIPFDLEAARSFITSELPEPSSIFGIHVRDALSRAYPKLVDPPPESRVWKPSDYSNFNVLAPDSTRAGLFLSLLFFALGMLLIAYGILGILAGKVAYVATIGAMAAFGAVAESESFRQLLGRLLRSFGTRSRSVRKR
jgi:MinD-like ATPase involved in chromosome partitioning or flagellar assembly